MKRTVKKLTVLLCMAVLVSSLTACSSGTVPQTQLETGTEASRETLPDKPAESVTKQQTTAAEAPETTETPETTEVPETEIVTVEVSSTEAPGAEVLQFLSQIQGEYYQHGGDWTTWLTVNADGTFSGEYSAHTNPGPKAHYDVGAFHGSFADLKQIDELTWTVRVESVTVDGEIGREWEDKEATYTQVADPGAPVEGTELTVYLPGTDSSQIPEEFFMWIRSSAEQMPELPGTALINDTEGINTYYYKMPEEN